VRRKDQRIALESFHSIAADVRLASQQHGREGLQSVAITSASRGEGKTFIACNLALVCAAHGARTLLIDADMRAGNVAHFLGFPPAGPGLSDALANGASVRDEWRGLRVSQSELWVLPAGNPTSLSPGLLESPRFGLLLALAEREFDQIIVDTPPLSMITDAATIASAVDSTVLVVRDGVTERKHLDRTLERLHRASNSPLGIVLNATNLEHSLYEYAI
jgi:capsular exopolysaccharide synthesis family protein